MLLIPRTKSNTNLNSLLLLAVLLTISFLFLSACNNPTVESDDTIGFTISIDQSIKDDIDNKYTAACFNGSSFNASAYMYSGSPTSPSDWGGNPDPLYRSPLEVDSFGNYTFTTDGITDSGSYKIAIVCDVDQDTAMGGESLTYISFRSYELVINNTIAFYSPASLPFWEFDTGGNRVNTHITHNANVPLGAVCDYCHFINDTFSFLLSDIDHEVLDTDCLMCHSGATASARVRPAGHITITATQVCSGCHSTNIWKPVL